jgi:hypothetical protein
LIVNEHSKENAFIDRWKDEQTDRMMDLQRDRRTHKRENRIDRQVDGWIERKRQTDLSIFYTNTLKLLLVILRERKIVKEGDR